MLGGPEVRLLEALDEPGPPKGHLANLGTAS